MIAIHMNGPTQWGTNEIPNGRQLNIKDQDSGVVVVVPFTDEPLMSLVAELAQGLTSEQKRALAPIFTNGIIIPGDGFRSGPQG